MVTGKFEVPIRSWSYIGRVCDIQLFEGGGDAPIRMIGKGKIEVGSLPDVSTTCVQSERPLISAKLQLCDGIAPPADPVPPSCEDIPPI